MSGKSPRCSRIVMLALSPAIGGVPRPYLHKRREELIFPFAAGTFLRVKGFCRGGPDPAGRLESAGGCLLGLLRIPMAEEDVAKTRGLSLSPDRVCYIIPKAREFDAKDGVIDPNDSSTPTDDAMVAVLEDPRDDPVV